MSEFNMKNFPKTVNGDTVIGFTNTAKIKSLGWADMASLSSWYQDDPDKNHLGMIELFSSMADYRMPTIKNLFKKGAVLEVNGARGKFRYDLPVVKPTGIYTVGDTSNYSPTPGRGGLPFPIKLDQPFTQGDVLTYDAMYGEQVIVSEDFPIEQEGDTWVHWVTYTANADEGFFPPDKLKSGIQYFKVNFGAGEFTTQFSSIQSPDNVGTITCEFELGNHRGVETSYTQYADMKRFSGASLRSQDNIEYFVRQMEKIRDFEGNPQDMFIVGNLNNRGKLDLRTARIGTTLEFLCGVELMKMETYSLLFQRAAKITDSNGTKILNEGTWHSFRRGKLIEYSRPGGLTKGHIKEAFAYLFRNRKDLMPMEREAEMTCGYMAYVNCMSLFKEEVLRQTDGLSWLIDTSSPLLKESPIKGKSLTSLEFEPIMFQAVNIPEIGKLRIKHDPALDYMPLTDKYSQGFYGDGYPRTSFSLLIEDAADPAVSNALTNLPAGTKLVGGKKIVESNVFYVKPEGPNMWWGYESGRYSPDKASGIMSSMKRMGREFWAHSMSAAWVKDITRTIMIEMKV